MEIEFIHLDILQTIESPALVPWSISRPQGGASHVYTCQCEAQDGQDTLVSYVIHLL